MYNDVQYLYITNLSGDIVGITDANGNLFYSLTSSLDGKSPVYSDQELKHRTTVTTENNTVSLKKMYDLTTHLFTYSMSTENNTTVINEIHNEKNYKTEIKEDSVLYTAAESTLLYKLGGDENSASQILNNGTSDVLVSDISYDDENSILKKEYNSENISFSVTYDENGNIISDGNNNYSYNSLGELTSSQGSINSSYTYDSRGNMLSKTVNGSKTTYSYENAQWLDQLTSVDNQPLEYDENGNLISYNGKTYSWNHGKRLDRIVDGDITYSYKYDSDGVRASKNTKDEKIYFNTVNGKLLAQYNSDKSKVLYFQYYNDAPIGFVYNDVQYLYITNLSGDIVGITDANGNLTAQYSYDEWGKLLSIKTAEAGNEEQQAIAEINPLRYRGYYYDTETGLYYLQSRYYSPELCRFISADDFSYVDTASKLNANAYIYCWNSPVAFDDKEGTTPQLSICLADIISYIQNIYNKIKDGVTAGIDRLKEKWNNLVEKIENSLKKHYNAFIDKV